MGEAESDAGERERPAEGAQAILKRAVLSGAAGAVLVLIGAMVVYARRGGR